MRRISLFAFALVVVACTFSEAPTTAGQAVTTTTAVVTATTESAPTTSFHQEADAGPDTTTKIDPSTLSFFDLWIARDVSWESDDWMIGPANLNDFGEPSRVFSVKRNTVSVFDLELGYRCGDGPLNGPAYTEEEIRSLFKDFVTGHDKPPGDHRFTFEFDPVTVMDRPAFTTLWADARDGRVEVASVSLWLAKGDDWCVLAGADTVSQHRAGFDPQDVIDFYPAFNEFANDLTGLLATPQASD